MSTALTSPSAALIACGRAQSEHANNAQTSEEAKIYTNKTLQVTLQQLLSEIHAVERADGTWAVQSTRVAALQGLGQLADAGDAAILELLETAQKLALPTESPPVSYAVLASRLQLFSSSAGGDCSSSELKSSWTAPRLDLKSALLQVRRTRSVARRARAFTCVHAHCRPFHSIIQQS